MWAKRSTSLLTISVLLFSCGSNVSYLKDDVEGYNIDEIVEEYHADFDSALLVFPKRIIDKSGATYHAKISSGLFDSTAEIILEQTLDITSYLSELERLRNISVTISDKNSGRIVKKEIKYDTEMYKYPAYIAIDGFADKYEYALCDASNCRIIYIYLSYPSNEFININNDYAKINLNSYHPKNSLEQFTIYANSFDGGKSYTEWDD